MPLRNTPDRFGVVARIFHWLVFLLLIGSFGLAWTMDGMRLSPAKLEIISWHKWVGVTVFLVVILRLGWRLVNTTPTHPPETKPLQKAAAALSHFLLYLIIIVMPITGWIMSSAKNLPVVYLGLFQIPGPYAGRKDVAELMEEIHETLATVLLVLVGIHVLAALYHHFFLRDNVLRRMLPWPARLRDDPPNG